ncbi:hypothetical protein CYMTET_19039, partial [Cymbomonas tetramitiformis]
GTPPTDIYVLAANVELKGTAQGTPVLPITSKPFQVVSSIAAKAAQGMGGRTGGPEFFAAAFFTFSGLCTEVDVYGFSGKPTLPYWDTGGGPRDRSSGSRPESLALHALMRDSGYPMMEQPISFDGL